MVLDELDQEEEEPYLRKMSGTGIQQHFAGATCSLVDIGILFSHCCFGQQPCLRPFKQRGA